MHKNVFRMPKQYPAINFLIKNRMYVHLLYKRFDIEQKMCFIQNDRNNTTSRFQGSTSISSEDYFGDPSKKAQNHSNYQGPDLSTMKADFKEGVSKAAGRLSSLASSVMSSIQVRIAVNLPTSLCISYRKNKSIS